MDYGHNMFATNTAYRTHNLNVTSHHSLKSGHDFFSNRVIKYWTQLPLRVRNSTSINAFKAGLSSGLLVKSSRLDISELRNYFTKIKLITSPSKWTGPYNNERMKYNKIR